MNFDESWKILRCNGEHISNYLVYLVMFYVIISKLSVDFDSKKNKTIFKSLKKWLRIIV